MASEYTDPDPTDPPLLDLATLASKSDPETYTCVVQNKALNDWGKYDDK